MTSEIQEAAATTLEVAKSLLAGQHAPGEYESQRDQCLDMASACKTVLDDLDAQMDAFKKQKRRIDDQMSELRSQQRPWKALYDDLKEYAKRHNNAFWDAKREMQTRNLPSS